VVIKYGYHLLFIYDVMIILDYYLNLYVRLNTGVIRVCLGLRFQKVRFKITILKCAI